jgi:hypothetical protein
MSRLGGVFWFVLVIVSGVTNFVVKQTVQGLDDQLTNVRRQTIAEQKKIHELTADWTYLNQPELLADLNNRYVHLVQISPKQVQTSLDGIPLRQPPTQTLDPVPQIAMATPPPAPAAPSAPTLAATLTPPMTSTSPAPAPVATLTPPTPSPTAPNPAPIVPVSAAASVHMAAAPVASEPPPARPPATASRTASLDSLFAQVAGDR